MSKCNGLECKNSAKFQVIYDGGESKEQKLSLCQVHYDSDSVFKQFILKIVELDV